MGEQIIKQPNGLYAIFSSIVDDFTWTDCTPEDIIEIRVERETKEIRAKVLDIVAQLEAGGKPYQNRTMSYDEALETIKAVHGEREAEEDD